MNGIDAVTAALDTENIEVELSVRLRRFPAKFVALAPSVTLSISPVGAVEGAEEGE